MQSVYNKEIDLKGREAQGLQLQFQQLNQFYSLVPRLTQGIHLFQ